MSELKQEKSVSLFCRHGGSDKVYKIFLKRVGDLWLTTSENGRRGSTMTPQYPMGQVPSDYETANRAFEKKLKEQARKYTEDADGNPLTGPIVVTIGGETPAGETPVTARASVPAAKPLSGWYPQLPIAFDEDRIRDLINDETFVGQEKKNGRYRGIEISADGVRGTNKKGEWIELSNELWWAAKLINSDYVFLVTEDCGDHADVHDILMRTNLSVIGSDPVDLRIFTYRDRRVVLDSLFDKYPALNEPQSALRMIDTAKGVKAKRAMYLSLKEAGAEGMVFKNDSALWAAGDSLDVLKVKFYALNCFIVTDRNVQRSVRLGLYDDNDKMIDLGNCSIPPNKPIPEVGSLIDVRYLYAFPGGKLHQPVYQCPRDDAIATQCRVSKLKFIQEER